MVNGRFPIVKRKIGTTAAKGVSRVLPFPTAVQAGGRYEKRAREIPRRLFANPFARILLRCRGGRCCRGGFGRGGRGGRGALSAGAGAAGAGSAAGGGGGASSFFEHAERRSPRPRQHEQQGKILTH